MIDTQLFHEVILVLGVLIAIALAQGRAQVADSVGKSQRNRGFAGPILAGEQGFFWALQA